MDLEQPIIKISVRNLVEFILRSGDIDKRTDRSEKDAMQMGSKMHRKIQRQMGSNYMAEVTLKYEMQCKGFAIRIEGRADGIIDTEAGMVIDEIKGVFLNLEYIKEPVEVHLAQARCYAYIFGKQNGLSEMGVQMTYCNLETEEIKRFQSVYQMDELERWFLELLGKYEKWARYQVEWKKKRDDSIKGVEFPFDYREGQKELVASVYRTILRQKKLFIQAPTGVGKTMATVFPAVKAIGEGLGDKIFYLTAKTITRTVAWQAFDTLKEQALRMKVIVLTAKDKICFCEESVCNPDACPYAKGHFDRVNDAVYELLTSSDEMNREIVEEQARKWKVCPHEMSLDIATWVDAVICDYNYVFDPNAHLRRFFGEGVKGEYLFLIDEAHNLVERGREMYSASLCKEDLLHVKRLVKTEDERLAAKLDSCNKQMLALKRECEEYEILDSASHVYIRVLTLMAEMERFMEECKNEELRQEVLDLYLQLRMFTIIYEKVDENYLIYSQLRWDGRFVLHLFCVNPAKNLQECLDKGNSTVFFSATLLPIHYYKELLSTDKDNYAIYANSPFDTGYRMLAIGSDVNTKYTRRGKDTYEKYAKYLWQVVRAKEGNYIAFFPSYKFMEQVYACFLDLVEETKEDISYVMQSQNMSEEDRESFLEQFQKDSKGSLLGFCVMGGIFSEGIDLAEDRLIGAIIVGTGIPQVCLERELLKQYFDKKGYWGFDYAYLYPGMNKVLQSAGRVIRTDDDKGVILLLDDRFLDRRYQDTFPREWEGFVRCNVANVGKNIEDFWRKF